MTTRRDFRGRADGRRCNRGRRRAAQANAMPYALERPLAPTTPTPMDAATRDLMMEALNASKMAGADYADVRIGRYRANFVQTREQQIVNVADTDSMGCGVRALVDGTWGFGATRTLTKDGVANAAKKAVAVAKATRLGRDRAVQLAPSPAYKDVAWQNAFTIDPWTIPIEQKADLLLKANAAAMKASNVKFVFSAMFFRKEERNYANTDGSVITQTIIPELGADADHRRRARRVRLPESRQRQRADGARIRIRPRAGHRRQRDEVGRRGVAEAQGEAGRRRPLRPRAAPEPPLAHDSRIHRTPDRARPRQRLRSELRRHQLRRAARKKCSASSSTARRVHERSGRPLAGRRTLHHRLRRRRREARRLPHHQERHLQRLPDHARAGQLAQVVVRLARHADAVARLLVRRLVVEHPVPAHAERLAASRRKGAELTRISSPRPTRASPSSATARSRSTSSATTRSSAARSSTRSRAARSSAC